jgi:L-asparaginase
LTTERAASARPRVDYLALGGTIASTRTDGNAGVSAVLTAQDIAASVEGIDEVADLRSSQFLQIPSASITLAQVLSLRDEIAARVAAGSRGVVLTQGTDTIEEVAFALDLLWDGDAPIVVTGAMRNPSLPGADGSVGRPPPVAASEAARGLGALVVMNDEIHAARFVRKVHTSSLAAFQSVATGPIGWVSEGHVRIVNRPVGRTHITVAAEAAVPPVALVRLALGDDGRLLGTLAGLGYAGAVIEAMGGGHVAEVTVPLVRELSRRMPVVLASRTGSGDVLAATYRFKGSEIELLEAGLISAGPLDGLKARLLLSLCLAAGYAPGRIGVEFAGFGGAS